MKFKPKTDKQGPNVFLMAAALQDHMLRDPRIRNLHLPTKRISSVKQLPKESKLPTRQLENKTPSIVLPKLIKRATENMIFDENARNQINRNQKSYQGRLSLAQKMSLVPAPKAPMAIKDWEGVLNVAKNTNQIYESCAICLEPFRTEKQVLLDCSHVFHKHCLQAFERLEQCPSCPMCRHKDYQQIDIDESAVTYLNKSATVIQSHFRRLMAEIGFQRMLKQIDSRQLPDSLKRRSLIFKMKQMSISAFKSMHKSKKNISKLVSLESLNPTRLANLNELMSAYISKFREIQQEKKIISPTIDWDHIADKFYNRGQRDCSICLAGFAANSQAYLLSCSHGFHVNCLAFFERYSKNATPLCPLCRNEYQRIQLVFNKIEASLY
jgi:hypothetical protein